MIKSNTQHYRPTQAVVNLTAIKKNLKLAASISGAPVMAVVKANAYGFGIEQVVKTIHKMEECESFAVAFAEEAFTLRKVLNKLKDDKRVLTLEGFFSPADLDAHIEHKIDATLHHSSQLEMLKHLPAKKSNQLGVWLKCNTRMNRLGLDSKEALAAYKWIKEQPHIKLLGIMTHFSSANRIDKSISIEQIARFYETIKPIWRDLSTLVNKGVLAEADVPRLSLCNSPGIMSGFSRDPFNLIPVIDSDEDGKGGGKGKKQHKRSRDQKLHSERILAELGSLKPQFISRPGLMLYGSSPLDQVSQQESAEALGITPVMNLTSKLIAVRKLKQGESVGYEDGSWVAPDDCLMGVAPIGYADGYPFIQLDRIDKLPVLVNGRKCFLAGRVSMDMLCVDLINCPDAKVGDEVELWGDKLSANEISDIYGGPPQRLFSDLTKRVPRIYQE